MTPSSHAGSQQKWLFTHGRKKWETFYSRAALDVQTQFFDRFLQDRDNGMAAVPSVRLECRRGFYQANLRAEATWPLSHVQPTPLYLWASPAALVSEPPRAEGVVAYRSHRIEQKIAPSEIVPVEIEILPSSTLFEAGTSVRLDIQGGDAARYPAFAHRRTVNRGTHRIHCSGRFDSQLHMPLVVR